jgi:hypothetical protein
VCLSFFIVSFFWFLLLFLFSSFLFTFVFIFVFGLLWVQILDYSNLIETKIFGCCLWDDNFVSNLFFSYLFLLVPPTTSRCRGGTTTASGRVVLEVIESRHNDYCSKQARHKVGALANICIKFLCEVTKMCMHTLPLEWFPYINSLENSVKNLLRMRIKGVFGSLSGVEPFHFLQQFGSQVRSGCIPK